MFRKLICNIMIIGTVCPAAFAQTIRLPDEVSEELFEKVEFVCRVMLVTESFETDIEQTFVAPAEGLGHGGEEHVFEKGPHKVVAMADGKWLGATWSENGKVVASAVTVQTHPTLHHRVLILIDPKTEGRRLSLDCTKK